MKHLTLLKFIFIISLQWSFGQTQNQMTFEAGQKYQQADKELNQVFQQILKVYSNDSIFIKQLQSTQVLWMQWRNSEINTRYLPGENYGSMLSICQSALAESFIRQRISYLKLWLDGIDHQEACKGTVKEK